MATEGRIFKPSDFDFMPKKKRKTAARLLNEGTAVAAHSTINSGIPKLEKPDENISAGIAKLLYGV